MATSDISRLRSMSVFSPRRRRSISEPLSEDLETISPLEPVAKAPQLDIPNISTAGITPDEPQNKFRNLYDRINSEYTPETQDIEAYRKLRDAFPQREEPSFMRKLVASTQAWDKKGGIDEIDKVLNQPYNEDLLDWKEKTQPHFQLASLEGQRNTQERTLLSNAIQAEYQNRRIDETERNNRAKEDAAVERNRIARIRAEMGPGWRMNARGPTVIVQNQATGEVKDTGITTGWMTEADRIEAEGWWRTEASRVQGQDAMDRAVLAGAEIWTDSKGNQYVQNPRDPNSMTPIPQGNAPAQPIGPLTQTQARATTPTDTRVLDNNRFREEIKKDPTIGKWITAPTTQNGDYGFMPPPEKEFLRGSKYEAELADYNRARKAVGYPPVGNQPIGGSNKPPEQRVEPQPPAASAPKPPSRGATNPRDPNYGKNGNGGASSIWDILPNTGSGQGTNPRQPIPATRPDGKVSIYDPKTGKTGSIDNTPEAIAAAKAAGYQVR